VVWKLDRLGRSLVEMMRTIDTLRRQNIKFQSITEHFDSDTPHGRFALQMHGAMAEYFLDLNRERTIEGLKAALARGRKGGRRRKLSDADLEAARAMLAAGTISVADIATRYGLLHGRVEGVSRDAVVNDHAPAGSARPRPGEAAKPSETDDDAPGGSVYVARISLSQTAVDTEQGLRPLEPGMQVTAEIKTGRRRVIEYLLSPLLRYRHEGLRER
jgi:hypothetical protein